MVSELPIPETTDTNGWVLICLVCGFKGGFVDMARQGCSLSEEEVKRIVSLLTNSEMTMFEIAQRMTCSRGAIATINRKFQVRKYAAPKSRWILVQN
jgi:hypothetical protein